MVTRTLSKFQHRSVDKRVVFATSFDNGKLICCDTFDGDVSVGGFPAITNCDNVPTSVWLPEVLAHWAGYGAMPVEDVIESSGVLGPSARKNHLQKYMHLLYWMYQFANTLHREASMQLLHKELPFSRGICLFPRSESKTSTCVTRGVRVKASPLFVPELSNPDECDLILFFAYSIKFELLDESTQQQEQELLAHPEAPFKSVQLLDRRWIIRDKNGEIESEVRGEGVIGEYPILLAGGDPFVYQSCTNIRNGMRGTMEGEFTFVEGTLAAPGSREIKAICERFTLEWPSVVF